MDDVLRWSSVSEAVTRDGRAATSDAVRAVLERLRKEIGAGALDDAGAQLAIEGIADAIERELRSSLRYSLQKVINATGVILHTNLGRAPISSAASAAAAMRMRSACWIVCSHPIVPRNLVLQTARLKPSW